MSPAAEAELAIASVREAQALPAGCGAVANVAGVQAGARPVQAAAQAAPTSVPTPPPDPSTQIARAAPRAGDSSLAWTLPLLGSGGTAMAGGVWLLARLLLRMRG